MATTETPEVAVEPERWWICLDWLSKGGDKVLGPFESEDLAMRVRWYVESVPVRQRPDKALQRQGTFYVDQEGRKGRHPMPAWIRQAHEHALRNGQRAEGSHD